jgi:hypothetical protein
MDSQTDLVADLRKRPGVEVLRQFRVTNAILARVDTDTASVPDLAEVKAVEEIYLKFKTTASRPVAIDGVVEVHGRNEDGLARVNAREA